jgi:CO/xanthine dehydrogenase Mo-binding subunit
MSLLGSSHARLEGLAKVTGSQRYTADELVAGLAAARLVLSHVAHARIAGFELAAARAVPGVLAVVTGADLPALPVGPTDQPLARDEVVYIGQPVVAVVAENEAAAADAAALVVVDYEPLPAVFDPLLALRRDAPWVLSQVGTGADHGEHGNAAGSRDVVDRPHNSSAMVRFVKGDAAAAIARAPAGAGGRYLIPSVHQGFLEPHVVAARREVDRTYTLWTSTQGIFTMRERAAQAMGLDQQRIRVIPTGIGGGFGGKISPLLEPLVMLLSGIVRRPVGLSLTRTEEFLMGRAAPAVNVELHIGAERDGHLLAVEARLVFDTGAGPSGLGRNAGMLVAGGYRFPEYDVTCIDVATNKTPVAAYRAPGAPQANFALESALDELADTLGLDPIELRLINAVREGDERPDRTTWPAIGGVACLEAALRDPLYMTPVGPDEGVGVAAGMVLGGTQPAAAGCRLDSDGHLVLQLGSVDLTGTDTALAMIAAETFGVPLEHVRVESGDTLMSPFAGASAGSKVTMTMSPAVIAAAQDAKHQLLDVASAELEAAVEDLVIADGRVMVAGAPHTAVPIAKLAALTVGYSARYAPIQGTGRAAVQETAPMFCVHVARVRTDRETGDWRLTGYSTFHDVGRAINPAEIRGQVHGGSVQGLARALGEAMVYDSEGQLLTSSFLDYEIPTIDQIPEIESQLIEIPAANNPLGVRGVGEPPIVPPAAAVANAIHAATGVRCRELPIRLTPRAARDVVDSRLPSG